MGEAMRRGSPKGGDGEDRSPSRDMIFVSHANPEDDEFTRWLALQLGREGYPVWCDLTKLLGGEAFWDDVEDTIRHRTCQFVFILSESSNQKDGALRELHLAQAVARKECLRDFVIPLKIDDLPHGDVTIELQRINSIDFNSSWGHGLSTLLEKLEEKGIPKKHNFGPAAVSCWWRTQYRPDCGIIRMPEEHLSNWYPIRELPKFIYRHHLSRTVIGKVEVPEQLPFPAFQEGTDLISFAPASDFQGALGPCVFIESSQPSSLSLLRTHKELKGHLARLLRLAWEEGLANSGMPMHTMARQAKCFYFTPQLIAGEKIPFRGVDGTQNRRGVVGYKTLRNQTRREWHFGITGKPLLSPVPLYCISPHVLFSSDGVQIWESAKRLASARRNQCRYWWNDEWRDRLLATMSWLSKGEEVIKLPAASRIEIPVEAQPMRFRSDVSFVEPGTRPIPWEWSEDEEEEEYERVRGRIRRAASRAGHTACVN